MSSHDCPGSSDATMAGRIDRRVIVTVPPGLFCGCVPVRSSSLEDLSGPALIPGCRSRGAARRQLPRHPHGLQHPGDETQPGTGDRPCRGRMQPAIRTVAQQGRQCEHQPDRRDPRGPFDPEGQAGLRLLRLNHARPPLPDAPGDRCRPRRSCHRPGLRSAKLDSLVAVRPGGGRSCASSLLGNSLVSTPQPPVREIFHNVQLDLLSIIYYYLNVRPAAPSAAAGLSVFEHRPASAIDSPPINMVSHRQREMKGTRPDHRHDVPRPVPVHPVRGLAMMPCYRGKSLPSERLKAASSPIPRLEGRLRCLPAKGGGRTPTRADFVGVAIAGQAAAWPRRTIQSGMHGVFRIGPLTDDCRINTHVISRATGDGRRGG